MVDIQSKEVIDKISDELKIQPAMTIPRALAEKIQLVYGINPQYDVKFVAGSTNDATTSDLMTTSATKDTYLVACMLTVSKDVVSNSINSKINAFAVGRANSSLLALRYEPVTAGTHQITFDFAHPIKLERGSVITITNSSGTASIDTLGIVYFYETDPQ